MKEMPPFHQQLRNALKFYVTKYLRENPKLEDTDIFHFTKAREVLDIAANLKLTPMTVWMKVNDINNELPKSFFSFFFPNKLSQVIEPVLAHYSYGKVNISFTQSQYELSQQSGVMHVAEVKALKEKAELLENNIVALTRRIAALDEENKRLLQSSKEISDENTKLKKQLEVLSQASDSHQREAINIRHSLSDQIEVYRKREEETQQKMADLVRVKAELFERCHNLEIEKEELLAKNKRLADMNAGLLKENLDLQRLVSKLSNKSANEPIGIEMAEQEGSRIGFFRKTS